MVFNKLFGPSINLLILDMFMENPDKFMNIREIARMVDKNPGSISRTVPQLVEQGLLEQVKVGQYVNAYHLNTENEIVNILIEFYSRLRGLADE